MLEHPNETKINQLYQSQPAMRHNVVIQDLKVRNSKVKIKIINSSEAVRPLGGELVERLKFPDQWSS